MHQPANLGSFTQLATLLGATFILAAVAGCGSAVPAPKSLVEYNAKDGAFALQAPEGWTTEGGGKSGRPWAKFTQGSAMIHVNSDVSGSLLGDIGGKPDEDSPDESPVAMLHSEIGLLEAKEKLGSYAEVGKPKDFSTPLGPARSTEFTAAGSFGGKLHGYRTTILGKDLRFVIYTQCTESDWPTLKDTYDKVLSSVKRGKPQP